MNEELLPSAAPEPESDPIPPPVLEPPPDEEPAVPVEVISVDELLERLTQGEEQLEEELEEIDADASAEALTDVPAVEPDPVAAIVDQVVGKLVDVVVDLGKIKEYTETTAQTLDHPALTTSFADYTVTEALLLFLLLAAFLSACARMLRGGLSWLRS